MQNELDLIKNKVFMPHDQLLTREELIKYTWHFYNDNGYLGEFMFHDNGDHIICDSCN
jgi:hypothetical protein